MAELEEVDEARARLVEDAEERADGRGREARLQVHLAEEDAELAQVDHARVVQVGLVEDLLDVPGGGTRGEKVEMEEAVRPVMGGGGGGGRGGDGGGWTSRRGWARGVAGCAHDREMVVNEVLLDAHDHPRLLAVPVRTRGRAA